MIRAREVTLIWLPSFVGGVAFTFALILLVGTLVFGIGDLPGETGGQTITILALQWITAITFGHSLVLSGSKKEFGDLPPVGLSRAIVTGICTAAVFITLMMIFGAELRPGGRIGTALVCGIFVTAGSLWLAKVAEHSVVVGAA